MAVKSPVSGRRRIRRRLTVSDVAGSGARQLVVWKYRLRMRKQFVTIPGDSHVWRVGHGKGAAMQDWNDYRLVLAVARAGSLTGAAETLRVNHSTAYRRLGSLEAQLGVRLFERLPGGSYLPTPAGERAAAAAERIETEAATLGRDIAGHDLRLTGRLRVTSSETLAFRLLTKAIGQFRSAHPGISVELAIDNRVLSLSRREADVALLLVSRVLVSSIFTAASSRRSLGPSMRGSHALGWGTPGASIPLSSCYSAGRSAVRGINAAEWLADQVSEETICLPHQ